MTELTDRASDLIHTGSALWIDIAPDGTQWEVHAVGEPPEPEVFVTLRYDPAFHDHLICGTWPTRAEAVRIASQLIAEDHTDNWV